jgi:hypothetical protein
LSNSTPGTIDERVVVVDRVGSQSLWTNLNLPRWTQCSRGNVPEEVYALCKVTSSLIDCVFSVP